MTAFHGDPQLKADLIERLNEAGASDGDLALIEVSAGPDARAGLAAEFGLHRGLVDMIALSHPTRPSAEDWAMTRQIVGAIASGSDLGAVMHDWTEWVWTAACPGLRDRAENDIVKAYGDNVADLHGRALTSAWPMAREWRALRGTTPAHPQTVGDYFAVEVMAAGCWDLRAMEGATSDVADLTIKAWMHFAEVDNGWTQDDRDAFQEVLNHAAGLLLDQPRAATQIGRNRELWHAFDRLMDEHEHFRAAGTRGMAHQQMLVDTVFGKVRSSLLEKLVEHADVARLNV